jgi:glycosyltransferase involved in cell wall biosynthesis
MKVLISVPGIWAAFQQAHELDRRGHLLAIVTSYPRFVLRRRGEKIDYQKVKSLPAGEVAARALRRIPNGAVRRCADYWKARIFDSQVRRLLDSRRLPPCDVFIGFSGFCLESMRAARAAGAVTIVLRNSAHMLSQLEILRSEYSRNGLAVDDTHPGIIERELLEYQEADYIRVPSEFARQTFVERGVPADKVLVIPHGVDLSDFGPAPKADATFRVLYASSLVVRKGIQYLLEAFATSDLPNSELVLVGGMSHEVRPILEQYTGAFHYGGKLPHRELWRAYTQSSVYVLPSLEEGFAVTILEAMACGVPVIVSENSGGRGVVRDGIDGFITPIRDVQALKEKLRFLHDNEVERQRMGQNGLERAREFGLDRYTERVVAECESVAMRR